MSRIFTEPSAAQYHSPGHPEAPFRVTRSAERLKAAGHRLEPPPVSASDEDILLAHSRGHWDSVRTGDHMEPDTPHHPGMEEIARTSLSGALAAMGSARDGEPAFSLMRPPGHHAGSSSIAGFCYVNNLAVAVLKALRDGSARRIAVLDIDVHHGNGTEELLLGREGFLFCSLHQVPLYPGTGLKSTDNCLDIPLPPGSGEKDFMRELEPALRSLLDFKPDLLAVSAGFDTYKEDPIAHLTLDKISYRRIGSLIADTGLPRFAVLEGGYSEALPELIERFLEGFLL